MSRWWAPEGAHIGPDETDLLRLQPGEDKRLDLGQYLLTVHRMGAAACEEVASGPIPDEFTLIKRLAAARAVFAPPVVEAVSKSLNDDRPYADLLVRDVLDDAEQGALAVFRTAVSGGVPAAIAAQRAGMVYGVPPESLGSFLPVAKELRAHPAALQDAADRALFSHVEKAVLEEMEALEPEWEEVSKAPAVLERPMVRPDQKATPYYDARDILGRFAKPTEAARVSDVLAKPVGVKAETPRLSRVARKVRQVRPTRQTREVRTEQTQTTQQSQVQQARVATTTIPQAQLEQMWVDAAKIPQKPPTGGGRGDWDDDLLAKMPGGEYDRLADMGEMRLVMGAADFNEFLSRAPEIAGTRMFRIGHLVKRLGPGSVQVPGSDHDSNVAEHASHFFNETGVAEPNVRVIPNDKIALAAARGKIELNNLYNDEAFEMAHDYAVYDRNLEEGSPEYERLVKAEMAEILAVTNFDEEGNRILQHVFPDAKPAPLVEFIIPAQAWEVRGSHGPHSGTGEIDLDPNQVYKIVAQAPEKRYDVKHGANIKQFAIMPVDPEDYDIEKAASVMVRPDRTDTPYYDARDITGRFTAAPVAISQALKAPKTERKQRLQRSTRPQRQQAEAKPVTQARVEQRTVAASSVQQARAAVARVTQAMAKQAPVVGKTGPGYHRIDPGRSYAVMQPEDLSVLVGGGEGPVDPETVATIIGSNYAHSRLHGTREYNGRLLFGEDLHPDLFDMDEEWDEGSPEWEPVRTPYPLTMIREIDAVGTDDEAQAARFKVDANAVEANATSMRLLANAMFEANPNITRLRLVRKGENDAVMAFRDLRDFGPEKPDPLVVVEIDDDLKPGKPAVLEMVSETRKNRLIPPTNNVIRTEEADSPDLAEQIEQGPAAGNGATFRNPRVRLYRLRSMRPDEREDGLGGLERR